MHCKGGSRENTISRYHQHDNHGHHDSHHHDSHHHDSHHHDGHHHDGHPGSGKYGMHQGHRGMNSQQNMRSSRGGGRYDEEAPMPPPLPPVNFAPPPPPTPVVCPPTAPGIPPPPPMNPDCNMKELNKMFGMTAADIDKYSRVIFPVSFFSFQLMYWVVYLHLSDETVDDLVFLHPEDAT